MQSRSVIAGRVSIIMKGMAPKGENDDLRLVVAAARGDGEAWRELIDRYAQLVWGVARGCGLSAADAEDVSQLVFSALVRRIAHLEDPAAVGGWLLVTTKREAWRFAASNRRRAEKRQQQSEETSDNPNLSNPSPDGDSLGFERRNAVRLALTRLDDRCRDLLMAFFGAAKEPGYDQIAKRLGMRPNSVGPTRRRCLDKLLAHLDADSGDLFEDRCEP